MSIVYIDFEADDDANIIEIGAIHIADRLVKQEFHCFTKRYIQPVYHYYRCAENSHCIPHNVLCKSGIYASEQILKFKNFIDSIDGKVILKGFGEDVMKQNLQRLFPFLQSKTNITYEQVILPPWSERQYEKYHISSRNLKDYSELLSCNAHNHAIEYYPNWLKHQKTHSHTRLAKLSYGHHCALVDSYELAFAEDTLDKYCCDMHFEKNFETNIDSMTEPLVFIE